MSTSDTSQRTTIVIESTDDDALTHVIRFYRGIQLSGGMRLTQGEMIDLWQKIGAYFNLAGMGELGERAHTHHYSGQTLRHSHDGGNEPHGYFEHPEDFPPERHPDELYNDEPLTPTPR